jgi:hypothetical protein
LLVNLIAVDTHDSVAAMAESYAQKAVVAARALNAQLDFSEGSLVALETILDGVARRPESQDLNESCKMWGSYLGEVVRRRFGGEWSIETYPGKQFATLTLSVKGSKLFPSMKIHRRLTAGEADNVWSFYQMVKARLESQPGGKVQ